MKFNIYSNSAIAALLSCSLTLGSCTSEEDDAPDSGNELSFRLTAQVDEMTPSRSDDSEKIIIASKEDKNITLEITSQPAYAGTSRSQCFTHIDDAKVFCYLWHDKDGWNSNVSPNLVYDNNIEFHGIESTLIKVSNEGQHYGLGVGFNIGVFGYTPQASPNCTTMAKTEKSFPYANYTLPQQADKHEDFMLGFYNISENLGGHHCMKFHHALSAVIVKVSPDAYVEPNENVDFRYINALRMTNLYVHGKCELEYIANPDIIPLSDGIKWSGLQGTIDAIHADFSMEEGRITEDGVTLTNGTPPPSPGAYFNSTFMMIPQTTPASADMCVIMTTQRPGGSSSNQQIHFSMGGITFKPGNVYTLTVMANR